MFGLNSAFISRYGVKGRRKEKYYSYNYGHEQFDESYFKKLENLNEGQKRSKTISDQQRKKILNRAFWLGTIASEKEVLGKNGRVLKYKLSFITLTLPGNSKMVAKDLNKKALNTFLTNMRRNVNMQNYIWRLEWQKNGKIHYHIITDAAVNYHYVRHVWNRIMKETGHMADYTKKFENMNLGEYTNHIRQVVKGEVNHNKIREWYVKGNREGWENPNSVDVVKVFDEKSLNYYLAKYISKDDGNDDLTGRIWGSSSELAQATEITHHLQDVLEFAYYQSVNHHKGEIFEMDYCTIVFVDWSNLFAWYPWLKAELISRAREFAELSAWKPIPTAPNLFQT